MHCIVISLVFFGSCVGDTDFEQANDIVLTPEIELNLIYFYLDASSFFDQEQNTPNLILKDTTDLEFLDGSDIKDILKRAEFLFTFTNSIPRDFEVSFDF